MARLAKTLLAGALVAILPCGAATSQTPPSSVLNNQVQFGDVFSQQTMNVVEVTDFTTADTNAVGNAFEATADGQALDVRSDQAANGDVAADTRLNVSGYSGDTVTVTNTATGNSGFVGSYDGTVTAVTNQNTAATAAISGNSRINAAGGSAGDVDSLNQATGNSQSFGLEYASAGIRANQTNGATVSTDGGGDYAYVSGTANFAATSTGNDITLDGQGSAAAVIAGQLNETDRIQASSFTGYGSVQTAATRATAAGNNINAVNEGPLLDAYADQRNQAYVRAEARNAASAYGTSSVNAYGVGNALTAGDIGGELILDTVQLNEGGGIEAVANFIGTDGYDATATSTAMGNSVTGYACSECEGRMSITNSQVNRSDVGAQSIVNVSGGGRSASSVSTAVGNTATYYVSRPSGQ
ncbi:MAG: holdfast anchor protein HfaD [Phenylobacterium sp.]|uniref:holdfast anchor protein HfaD n=1 Tax=Phenylobacterium sp. TaxID=1871053 RepID=UPI0027354188|nr:holdfast anchor protein HfaD [Phenylobacterium sp.]MDP3748447.1 holdfast anchor protein HfaD [Phenylobacterium sp.]